MILIDTNVLMYSAGAEHENKAPAISLLHRVALGEIEATIDTEVLQEIMHRYLHLKRWPEGRRLYELTRELFPEVLSITGAVMDTAKKLADEDVSVSARDAVHAAVVISYKLEGIYSFDADFDRIRGCKRLSL